MDPVAHLATAVEEAAADIGMDGSRAGLKLDRPARPDFGDYSTNAAMLLAPSLGEPPRAVAEKLGDRPDIVFEHVGKATFPTSVFVVKPFGKVVICAGTTGFDLDFDVRYLWMRQKQIIGSHFANAYECMKANELIEAGQIRPVLWRTLGFEGVPEAHQLMRDNRHLGKIAILVGAERAGQGKTAEGPGAIMAEVGA